MLQNKRKQGLPPGPTGYPIVGALPMWKGPETNLEWAKEYGDIYSVKLGPRLNVYLNTIELVNQYLVKQGHLYEDRPPGPAAIGQGLLFGSGSHWKLNRKLAGNVTWRNGALAAFEKMFITEMDTIIPTLDSNPVIICSVLRPYIVNVIVNVIRGERYHHDNQDFDRLLQVMSRLDNVDLVSFSTIMSLKFPMIYSAFCPNSPNLPDIGKKTQDFIREWISTSSTQKKAETIIGAFNQSSEYNEQASDDKEMVQSAMDMFFGGVTSTMSVLEFLFLYLIHDPKLQFRIQEQLDNLLGTRSPSFEDKEKLPLIEAVILETLRLGSITPSSLPHVSVEDTEIEGYHIPKGTAVVASLYSLHRDSRHFENPEVFNPDRHVDENGDVIRPKSFLPFGVGPRLCIGDTMVRVGVFMFVATVLQKFTVTAVDDESLPPFSSRLRIVRRLEPYEVVFRPRTLKS